VQVDGGAPASRSGALAVLALPPVTAPPATAAPVTTLPRRRPAAPAPFGRPARGGDTPAVLQQAWASDVATMHRLLGALQRLG